ncbi:SRPBCC family protein [Cognatishimia sp. SS12]|uniref:SRPBCC family protein n=1 Tax=Cognatishimia sp. SS12 TaxID=2979465 RepID=UPI00232DE859|nr:SRPBCC family protein [Cognatishimia sp. SS12]MDC0737352.1 SRPBCC family protein [Cognatishimia sp. SS12]
MNYSVEMEIDLHRDRVVEMLTTHDTRRRWQPGFVGHVPLDGTPGTVGATTQLTFQVGEQRFHMIETILDRDLPRSFTVSYVSMQSASISRNRFTDVDGGRTLWTVDMQMKLQGTYKLMSMLSKNTFRAQTEALMRSFADYAAR